MKSKLSRIKTAYNDEGEYDRQLYFQQQKVIYSREIDFATKVDAITENNFKLKPLEIGFLNSSAVKDQPKFKEIKKIFVDYNKEVMNSGEVVINGLHLKKVVMDSMLKFMNLMLLAPDTTTKKTILDISYQWFLRHLNTRTTRMSNVDLVREIKEILVQKKLLPIELVNKELIINRVNDELRPYKIRARTMYKELDNPKTELQKYNTHQLEFISHSKGNLDKQKPKKWIDTVRFPKIQQLAFSTEEPIEEKQEEDKIAEGTQDPNKNAGSGEGQAEMKLDSEGKPIFPEESANNNQQADLDFGEPAEPEPDAEPQEVEQADEKKRGKLDPLLKRFILERIKEKEKGEVVASKIREREINNTNLQYEEDFVSAAYIRQWAKQKGKLKTEIVKKNKSMRSGERPGRTGLSNYLENEIDRIRVKATIQENLKNITCYQYHNQSQDISDRINAEEGLSVFDRRRAKTETSKPFSSILEDHSRIQQQNQALDQINQIKQKFSKYKLYTPLDKLIKGLAPMDEEGKQGDSDPVLWPNSQMLSNPFFKVAKKKKKKKKK